MSRQLDSLCVLSLALLFSTYGPVDAQTKDDGSLYQKSLRAYAEAKSEQGGIKDNLVVRANNVIQDVHVAENFPSKIGSLTIEYLTDNLLLERYRRIGKGFPIVEILPMRNSLGLLVVGCAEYRVEVRHGKLVLGVFGGYEIHWQFDCSKHEYVSVNVKRWNALTL